MRIRSLALTLACLTLAASEWTLPFPKAAPGTSTALPSGLAFEVLQKGDGAQKPRKDDLVRIYFSGWTQDGKRVAFTDPKEQPPTLFLSNLMPGMRESLSEMTAGEKRRLWMPEALAFNGAKDKPAGPMVMELELIEILEHPSKAPVDVSGIPSDALLLKSGLAYKVLKKGTGTESPNRRNWVNVHYSGWTTDGKLFDSSLLRRETAGFKLNEVIAGWTEGLQLMVAGERRRFWIPEKLAYKGERGKPAGMLVFDVELVSFVK